MRRTTRTTIFSWANSSAGATRAALEELYDRHGGAVYGLARRVVADEQLAHDVVQEVFLAIWRGAATYDGSRGSLSTWLFALTHHKSVDAVRRSQRHSGRRAPEEALTTRPTPRLRSMNRLFRRCGATKFEPRWPRCPNRSDGH